MEGEKEADDGGDDNGGANQVEVLHPFPEGETLGVVLAGNLEDEDYDYHCDGSDGQVDQEAEFPGYLIGKHTTEKGTGDGGDAEHATEEAKGYGSFAERYCGCSC